MSSTYYDLKHIRASLDSFLEALGFEGVLSEKGSIAYTPDQPLDESCYREVSNSDVFVLIVGGRYGSESSESPVELPKTFFERYDSITKLEYKSAVEKDIPIYILIDASVYGEYQTFLNNKRNDKIVYAHVDSVNVFHLIEEILSQKRNNPMNTFDKYEQIENWLREQWSGFFRELLQRRSDDKQISSLTVQVEQLAEINKTLKTYLESLMTTEPSERFERIIIQESKRLKAASIAAKLRKNDFIDYMCDAGLNFKDATDILIDSKNFDEFVKRIQIKNKDEGYIQDIVATLKRIPAARKDLNNARRIVEKPTFRFSKKFVV